ncbi:MAG: HAMP domain-containing sensor histidine kinase [Motiliproteus sp.]
MIWRPRSILQLVLIGFTIVVAPLALAIFFTLQTLDQQATDSNKTTRELVNVTRQSQRLQTDMLDLERLARQFATLDDASLLPIFESTITSSHQELAQLQGLLEVSLLPFTQALSDQLIGLAEGVPAIDSANPDSYSVLLSFDQLNRDSRLLQQAITQLVDDRLRHQADQVRAVKTLLRNWLIVAAMLTLASALLFIYWISTPIRQIEKKIRALGSGKPKEINISGPLEMRALGQQLDWLKQQLEQLEEQKKQFFRHVSHELKTPLASLREGTDLMAEGVVGELGKQQQEVVHILQQNSRELQRLIENLLDFNHSLEQSSLQYQQLSLDDLIADLLSPYQMQIQRRRLQLQLQPQPQPLYCFADSGKLRTALDNLISNAVNYSEQGGSILISWHSLDSWLNIDVANSGEPISEPESARIFEPFFQGKASRGGAIKGSGIGLSVARECINVQGGQLTLFNKPGWSNCFRITLPLLNEQPPIPTNQAVALESDSSAMANKVSK